MSQIGTYPLKLIPCRKGSRSHVGSNPTVPTTSGLNFAPKHLVLFSYIFVYELQ